MGAPPRPIGFGFVAIALLVASLIHSRVAAQSAGTAVIAAPRAGEVLSGSVQISGTADSPSFASAELAFAYASDGTNTWFTIQEIDRPMANSELATWDTTSISDGEYVLRLRVTSLDGTSIDSTVAVQVRNYTSAVVAVPSPTPTKALPVQVPAPVEIVASSTPAPVTPATPTALPTNPAAVSESSVYGVFWRGALVVAILVLALGLVFLRRST